MLILFTLVATCSVANSVPFSPTEISTSTNETTISEQESFNLSKDFAVQFVLSKVLRALGPRFEDSLPVAPTNATLTAFNSESPLKVQATGRCPSNFRRCSSLTFYPSCDLPLNTNEYMWRRKFTLFFNISHHLTPIRRRDVLNATLRLYKNFSLPLSQPMTLIVRLHAFKTTLRRNHDRSAIINTVRVSSDYVGWVFINVAKYFRMLKRRHNYGLKITIINELNEMWNIPDLFIKMDCEASNETLVPLPFEIIPLLENSTQRYPALNIRYGSPFTDQGSSRHRNPLPIRTNEPFQLKGNVILNDYSSTSSNYRSPVSSSISHMKAHVRNLDVQVNPHLYRDIVGFNPSENPNDEASVDYDYMDSSSNDYYDTHFVKQGGHYSQTPSVYRNSNRPDHYITQDYIGDYGTQFHDNYYNVKQSRTYSPDFDNYSNVNSNYTDGNLDYNGNYESESRPYERDYSEPDPYFYHTPNHREEPMEPWGLHNQNHSQPIRYLSSPFATNKNSTARLRRKRRRRQQAAHRHRILVRNQRHHRNSQLKHRRFNSESYY